MADLRDEICRRLDGLVSGGELPSAAYAVVHGGEVTAGGFGGAGPESVFQVGSVTKVFTALLLAGLAGRDQVELSAPAASYLPEIAPGKVTLLDLATHMSGLPRLPPGLWRYALLHPADPYSRYPVARFTRAARRSLSTASGRQPYEYSNYGYGVLGYLLGLAAGAPYQALVAERICGPLGLYDTTFDGKPVPGYRQARPVPPWHMGPLVAAGGLYSTAADLAKLLTACLAPDETPLAGPIAAALKPRRIIEAGGAGAEIGLAWHHARRADQRVIWHNGMTGGFSAMIAINPARQAGVAVLANSGGTLPSPLDALVLDALG